MSKWELLLLLFLYWLRVCDSLYLEAVVVPQFRFRGQNATLLCKYKLNANEKLFSLKWYKEDVEFYRYTPPHEAVKSHYSHGTRPYSYGNNDRHSRPRQKVPSDSVLTWDIPGVKINLRESHPQKVELKKVSFKSSGKYRCEVTAEEYGRSRTGESFLQEFKSKESLNRMTVVELPSAKPIISGGKLNPEYKPGDLLNLTCRSAPSNPAARLEWVINGRAVSTEYLDSQRQESHNRGLYTSVLGLLMPLSERHFGSDGELRVKCKGTIAAEFWANDSESIFHDLSPQSDTSIRVLEVQESQWPVSSASIATMSLTLVFCAVLSSLAT